MKTSEQKKQINIFWPGLLTIISDILLAVVIVYVIGQAIPGDVEYSLGTIIFMALLARDGATDMRIDVAIERAFRARNLDGGSQ